ncbi:MerR family transcriptional regulator [Sphaerisporangium sp. TRM90804]|uniref:MerR family transcriptional regulator n=1 Tax=Sphaerisporangium sp. TRM90804 TaxID=3031113 RepID=UPI00244CAE22|nr:MerR family transcriptional regulator [Sphaerisporangium sp. TRM90804]MDH2424531.1 MerR family transcriptional regulator [Sphaerisporangium sp. TRM90804]
MSDTWTIGELAERAAETLRPASQQPNGRVRDVPNERLIRWYTTIGLVDPPLTRRGRVALYGRRHLLQLVAVKRRQAEGRSIADIQTELAGATDTALEGIALLPAPPAGRTPPPPPPARPRFWAQRPTAPPTPAPAPAPSPAPAHPPSAPAVDGRPRPAGRPAPVTPIGTPPAGTPPEASLTDTPPEASPAGTPAGLVHGVRLAPGVTLLLEGRAPSPEDVAALRRAAEPLLAAVQARSLATPGDVTPATRDAVAPGAGGDLTGEAARQAPLLATPAAHDRPSDDLRPSRSEGIQR